jgi:predicted anti-sigma-YlaC factor YlaD
MGHRTVKEQYNAWCEGRLTAGDRRGVRDHLDGCVECRLYYKRMSILMEKPDPALLPRLSPDPLLPARIRGLVADRKASPDRGHAVAWLRLSLAGVTLVFAAAAGVYLGQGLSAAARGAESAEGTDIAEAYYEAFAPSDFSGVWESVLSEAERNGVSEAKR